MRESQGRSSTNQRLLQTQKLHGRETIPRSVSGWAIRERKPLFDAYKTCEAYGKQQQQQHPSRILVLLHQLGRRDLAAVRDGIHDFTHGARMRDWARGGSPRERHDEALWGWRARVRVQVDLRIEAVEHRRVRFNRLAIRRHVRGHLAVILRRMVDDGESHEAARQMLACSAHAEPSLYLDS